MSILVLSALTILVFVILYQIARAGELASVITGEERAQRRTNRTIAFLLMIFFVLGMYGVYLCHDYLDDYLLPKSASAQGEAYDSMLLTTIIVTGAVFFVTQTLLFWFAWKYQDRGEGHKTYFLSHNNKLEIIWTTLPAIAMFLLVAIGLKNWLNFTSEAPSDAQVVEIVGKQFNWLVRYPGPDGVLGSRDFRKINDVDNVLGLDWNKKENLDDIIAQNGELHLVVNKPVKLIIGSRDVIHNVGLPHFRFKMDAVPGIVTSIWFTPTITTKEMKKITGDQDFVYEIACDQMCGNGHYSMRGTIIVETQEEYDAYMKEQTSYYNTVNATETPAPATNDAAPTADSTAVASK